MHSKSNIAALFKGQAIGDVSPTSRDLKLTTSPQDIQSGVTPNYALSVGSYQATDLSTNTIQTASSAVDAEGAVWFLMRVSYGREQKAKDYLMAKGIEVFLPMQEKHYVCNGKRIRKMQSLIPNFLFVKSTEEEMKKYIGKEPLEFFHHYYVPKKEIGGGKFGRSGKKPLVIPNSQMEKFIKWNTVDDLNKLFIADDKITFCNKEKVRILGGQFQGFEGQVFRIKGQSRVGVSIEGVGTIFTAYIPKGMLEKI